MYNLQTCTQSTTYTHKLHTVYIETIKSSIVNLYKIEAIDRDAYPHKMTSKLKAKITILKLDPISAISN